MSDVTEWLQGQGLGKYCDAFAENSIEWSILEKLTTDDLREIGLNIGERRKFLDAVSKLGSHEAEPTDPVSTNTSTVKTGAERRQLTVMFCDMVGSTELSRRLDPEDLREVVRAYQQAADAVIQRFDGYIAQHLGDGLLVYFGYPVAHEDDAQRAVYAGLGIVDAMADLNRRLKSDFAVHLSIRIGVHTGPVVIGEMGSARHLENLAMGETPNLAARLQERAEPDTVVISDATRQLLGEVFDIAPIGEHDLKGIAGSTTLFAVRHERLVETRFQARQQANLETMLGRQQELALLKDRWIQTRRGEGQMVVLTGEAGIGKSRIVRELTDALREDDHWRISYQCSPYHTGTELFPATQHLALAADFTSADSPDEKLNKLERLLRKGQEDTSTSVALIGALLGMGEIAEARYGVLDFSVQRHRAQKLRALLNQLTGLARIKPVLFLLEDAHWIDPTTLELIELTLDIIPAHKIMMLVTARPTFTNDFGGHPNVTRLTLNKLGREPVISMLERITGGKTLPSELLDEIVRKTDGVPLFVEEFTKTLLESGQLRETDQGYVFNGQLDQLTVPSSLHDSLMARLDRLQPLKEVAQTAACIGREFPYEMLSAVSPLSDQDLKAALQELVTAEMVFRRGGLDSIIYIFKHALVRDAAYQSLLKSKRQSIHHKLLAKLLESNDTAPALLAHHAAEAGRIAEAVNYSEQAGDQALSRAAFGEAVSNFQRAVEQARNVADSGAAKQRLLSVIQRLLDALLPQARYEEISNELDEAEQIASDLNDPKALFRITCSRSHIEWIHKGNHMRSIELAKGILLQSDANSVTTTARIQPHFNIGQAEWSMGNLVASVAAYQDGLRILDTAGSTNRFSQHFAVLCRVWMVMSLVDMGRSIESMEAASEALAIAQSSGNPWLLLAADFGLANAYLGAGEHESTVDVCQRALQIPESEKIPQWYMPIQALLGQALTGLGRFDEALSGIHATIAFMVAVKMNASLSHWLVFQAQAEFLSGRHDIAKRTATRLYDMAKERQEAIPQAEALVILASIDMQSQSPNWETTGQMLDDAKKIYQACQAYPKLLQCLLVVARYGRQTNQKQVERQATRQVTEIISTLPPTAFTRHIEAEVATFQS